MFKVLFFFFGEREIQYKYPNNFKLVKGTYVVVSNKRSKEISKGRSDFGSTPNRSELDMASLPKI